MPDFWYQDRYNCRSIDNNPFLPTCPSGWAPKKWNWNNLCWWIWWSVIILFFSFLLKDTTQFKSKYASYYIRCQVLIQLDAEGKCKSVLILRQMVYILNYKTPKLKTWTLTSPLLSKVPSVNHLSTRTLSTSDMFMRFKIWIDPLKRQCLSHRAINMINSWYPSTIIQVGTITRPLPEMSTVKLCIE